MSDIVVQRVTADWMFARPEWGLLLAEYARECRSPAMPPAQPDQDAYRALEIRGLLTVLAAMRGEHLAGLASLIVSRLPHHSRLMLLVESLFVHPADRQSRAGLVLLREITREAESRGCAGVVFSAPVGSQFAALLDRKKGCVRTAHTYVLPL